MTKFSKPKVWDKILEGSTLLPVRPKASIASKPAVPSLLLWTNAGTNRWTDRQTGGHRHKPCFAYYAGSANNCLRGPRISRALGHPRGLIRHCNMRRNSQLSLALAAPCRTPRRADWQLTTSRWKPSTTAANQYSWDAAVDTRLTHTFLRGS